MDLPEQSTLYRFVSNGVVIRIEFQFIPTDKESPRKWVPMSKNGYIGAEAYGFRSLEPLEFSNTRQARQFIKEAYGNTGLQKLADCWVPIHAFADIS